MWSIYPPIHLRNLWHLPFDLYQAKMLIDAFMFGFLQDFCFSWSFKSDCFLWKTFIQRYLTMFICIWYNMYIYIYIISPIFPIHIKTCVCIQHRTRMLPWLKILRFCESLDWISKPASTSEIWGLSFELVKRSYCQQTLTCPAYWHIGCECSSAVTVFFVGSLTAVEMRF